MKKPLFVFAILMFIPLMAIGQSAAPLKSLYGGGYWQFHLTDDEHYIGNNPPPAWDHHELSYSLELYGSFSQFLADGTYHWKSDCNLMLHNYYSFEEWWLGTITCSCENYKRSGPSLPPWSTNTTTQPLFSPINADGTIAVCSLDTRSLCPYPNSADPYCGYCNRSDGRVYPNRYEWYDGLPFVFEIPAQPGNYTFTVADEKTDVVIEKKGDGLPKIRINYHRAFQVQGDYSENDTRDIVLEIERTDLMQFIDPLKAIANATSINAINPSVWASSDNFVEGVTADGNTRLIVSIKKDDIESAHLTISSDDGISSGLGTLSNLSQSSESNELDAFPISTDKGDYIFAVYKAPNDFIRDQVSGDGSLTKRYVKIKAELHGLSGGTSIIENSIKIIRPPVVLMHGLWGDEKAFESEIFQHVLYDRLVYFRDYKGSNHLEFSQNISRLPEFIQEAFRIMRKDGIAVTRADVVAHSMGGLLSRLYIQNDALYKRPDNYFQGDVNRLITLNSPHGGSPFADLIIYLSDYCEHFGYNCGTANLMDDPLATRPQNGCKFLKWLECSHWTSGKNNGFSGGAVADLRSGNPRIAALNLTAIPSHAFCSDVSGAYFVEHPGDEFMWFVIFGVVRHITGQALINDNEDEFFCSRGHDYIVPLASQIGGLAPGNTTPLGNLAHTEVKKSQIAPQIKDLLDTPKSDPIWGNFPGYSQIQSCFPPPFPPLPTLQKASYTQKSANIADSEGENPISLKSPEKGTIFHPGDLINIAVDISIHSDSLKMLIIGDGIEQLVSGAPYAANWEIPMDAAGQVQLAIVAINNDEIIGGIGPINYPIMITEQPDSITVSPELVNLAGYNGLEFLSIIASYTNGVVRNVSSSMCGTIYRSLDTTIAVVDSNCIIYGRNKGRTNIIVSNSGRYDTCMVSVLSDEVLELIDVSAPRITVLGQPPDTLCLGDNYRINILISDRESGIKTQSHPNGEFIFKTSILGDFDLNVNATDNAGNFNGVSLPYTVVNCGQNSILFGNITANGIGLAGIMISLLDNNGYKLDSALSDDTGYYHVDSIPNGNYSITIHPPLGYEPDSLIKHVTANHVPVMVNFTLAKVAEVAKATAIPTIWYHSWMSSSPTGTIRAYIGNIPAGHTANNIVPSTIRLNSQVPIFGNTSRVRTSMTGFTGSVLEIAFNRQLAVQSLSSPIHDSAYQVIMSGDFADGSKFLAPVEIALVGGGATKETMADEEVIPETYSLGDAYPNPFNPNTTIEFGLPNPSHATLEIFNVLGQKIKTLIDHDLPAGNHSTQWNSTDDNGNPVATGIYLYKLIAGEFTETKKMQLLK